MSVQTAELASWPVDATSSIAFVGARPNTIATEWLPRNLRTYGFAGDLWLVSRRHADALGPDAYSSVEDLPSVPDAMILAVGPAECIRLTREYTARGTRLVIVYANGFGETGTAAGRRIERELAGSVRGDSLLVGPSSLGAADFRAGICTFGPPLPSDLRVGPVSIVSQSGALLSSMLGAASDEGFGVDWCTSVGSGARFTVTQAVRFALSRPDTRVVGVYFEGFSSHEDMAALEGPLDAAAAEGKRVVALCAGASAAGASVAASHTGAIGRDDRLLDSFLRLHHVQRVETLSDLVRTVNVLRLDHARTKPRRLGEGLAIIEPSGGATAIAADAASEQGIRIATLSEETRAFLRHIGGPSAHVTNPVDLTAATHDASAVDTAYGMVFADEGVGAVLVPWSVTVPDGTAAREYHGGSLLRHMKLATQIGVPVVVATSAPQRWTQWARERQSELPPNMAVVNGVGTTVRALRAMLGTSDRVDAAGEAPADLDGQQQTFVSATQSPIEEAKALQLLAAVDVPVAKSVVVPLDALDDAARLVQGLRPPYAVKVVAQGLAHKAAVGGVRLGVPDPADAPDAARGVVEAATRAGIVESRIDGVLVAEMAFGPELMVGLSRDKVFGDYVVVGFGGILTEAIDRHVIELLDPTGPADAVDRAICALGHGEMLRATLDAARPVLLRLCEEFNGGALRGYRTVEVNPLIVSPHGAVVADALAVANAEGAT